MYTCIPLLSMSTSCAHNMALYAFDCIAFNCGDCLPSLHTFPSPKGEETLNPSTYCVDGCVNHYEQVQGRLDVIQFIVCNSSLQFNCSNQQLVLEYLVVSPVFPSDRVTGLKWFSEVCQGSLSEG